MACGIDGDGADRKPVGGSGKGFAPPKDSLDPGHELFGMKRLDHVIVRPHFESHNTIGLLPLGRDDDHGSRRDLWILLDHAVYGQPVETRKHEVEKNEVGARSPHGGEAGTSVGNMLNIEMLRFEVVKNEPCDIRVILDQKNLFWHGSSGLLGIPPPRSAGKEYSSPGRRSIKIRDRIRNDPQDMLGNFPIHDRKASEDRRVGAQTSDNIKTIGVEGQADIGR